MDAFSPCIPSEMRGKARMCVGSGFTHTRIVTAAKCTGKRTKPHRYGNPFGSDQGFGKLDGQWPNSKVTQVFDRIWEAM
jgi:hypothetical protein